MTERKTVKVTLTSANVAEVLDGLSAYFAKSGCEQVTAYVAMMFLIERMEEDTSLKRDDPRMVNLLDAMRPHIWKARDEDPK